MFSEDAPVPKDNGDKGAVILSDCGGPGDEIWGPEMDSFGSELGVPLQKFGDDGDDLDAGAEGTSTSNIFGDFIVGDFEGPGILKKFDGPENCSSTDVRFGGGGDKGGYWFGVGGVGGTGLLDRASLGS